MLSNFLNNLNILPILNTLRTNAAVSSCLPPVNYSIVAIRDTITITKSKTLLANVKYLRPIPIIFMSASKRNINVNITFASSILSLIQSGILFQIKQNRIAFKINRNNIAFSNMREVAIS